MAKNLDWSYLKHNAAKPQSSRTGPVRVVWKQPCDDGGSVIGNRSQSVIVLFLVDSLLVEFPGFLFFPPLSSFLTDGRVTVSWL